MPKSTEAPIDNGWFSQRCCGEVERSVLDANYAGRARAEHAGAEFFRREGRGYPASLMSRILSYASCIGRLQQREGSHGQQGFRMRGRDGRRAAAMSRVYVALTRDRWNLRWAARHAGSPKLKRRLRRIGFRRAQQTRQFAESARMMGAGEAPVGDSFARDIGRANGISTVAACFRSSRKLRVAIEDALGANPSDKITLELERLHDRAANWAGLFEARLRDIATGGFAYSPPIVE